MQISLCNENVIYSPYVIPKEYVLTTIVSNSEFDIWQIGNGDVEDLGSSGEALKIIEIDSEYSCLI
jgi:hypothetical protein